MPTPPPASERLQRPTEPDLFAGLDHPTAPAASERQPDPVDAETRLAAERPTRPVEVTPDPDRLRGLRAITIWQPWASLLVAGIKLHETRSWPTTHRGPLLIHAAKRWSRPQRDAIASTPGLRHALRHLRSPNDETAKLAPGDLPAHLAHAATLPRGSLLGLVHLTTCLPADDALALLTPEQRRLEHPLGHFTPTRFAWHCHPVETFTPPLPAVGQQGFWTL